jgi:hypothetical protein
MQFENSVEINSSGETVYALYAYVAALTYMGS